MNNSLRKDIIEVFKNQFEANCSNMLLNAYAMLRNKSGINELTENNITVQLVGVMKKNPNRFSLQISVSREHYLDNEETYSGDIDADESPRIDIKYSTWNSEQEYEYFMEAKNLSEINWKRSDGTLVNALALIKRYVSKGIDNFVIGKYENGCLIGYVLKGSPDNIVQQLNKILSQSGRDQEGLTKVNSRTFPYSYYSSYPSSNQKILKHFMLNFCKDSN